MAVTEDILSHQLEVDVFHAEDNMVSGIARRAVDFGYDLLSPAQKRVLEPFLSKRCSGYTDPVDHNECHVILKDEALLEAYEDAEDSEYLQCETCRAERDYLDYREDKIRNE